MHTYIQRQNQQVNCRHVKITYLLAAAEPAWGTRSTAAAVPSSPDKNADTAGTDDVSSSHVTFAQIRKTHQFFVDDVHCRPTDPDYSNAQHPVSNNQTHSYFSSTKIQQIHYYKNMAVKGM